MNNHGSITERAMLIDLSVKQWSASKHDKRASRDVADKHGSDVSMGRYNKQLLAPDALVKVKATVNRMRAEHYKRTLPWSEDGARILSSAGYLDYTQAMRELEAEFWVHVDAFVNLYPDYVREAKYKLNGLFNPAEYPSENRIRDKFSCGFNVLPLPQSSDFRVQLGDIETERIKAQIDADVRATLDTAMNDVWERMREHVAHMAERLRAYTVTPEGVSGTFRDTLVSNIRELVALLPTLNVTGNPDITRFTERMKTELCQYSADTLRSSNYAREETAAAAESILHQMGDFI